MRKSWKVMIAAALACAATASVAFAEDYDYEKKDYWYKEAGALQSFSNYNTMEELFTALGAPDAGYDVNAYINSEAGKMMMDQCWQYVEWSDPMDEGLLDYWKNYEGGILKEMHHEGEEDFEWASYMPMSSYEEENADKKYPVMVVCRGGNDAKYTAECFGFVHYAAKTQEYMVVIPTDREPDAVQRMLEELKEDYPVDESKIYITGNSMGGLATLNNGWANPETFAGIAPFGIGVQNYLSVAQTAKVAKLKMPVMYLYGTMDCYHSLPVSECALKPLDEGVAELNALLTAEGCVFDEITEESVLDLAVNGKDVLTKTSGIQFPYTSEETYEDTTYYIGEYRTEDGCPLVKLVLADGGTHWHSPSYPEIIWNYFKQFSRNTETGELVVQE